MRQGDLECLWPSENSATGGYPEGSKERAALTCRYLNYSSSDEHEGSTPSPQGSFPHAPPSSSLALLSLSFPRISWDGKTQGREVKQKSSSLQRTIRGVSVLL